MTSQQATADLDHELSLWLDMKDDEPREVIVEARVPIRRVRLAAGATHGPRPHEVITEEGPSRVAVLEELQHFLTKVVGHPPRILRAAGAVPLLATRIQWLTDRLTPSPAPVKDLRFDAEEAGFAPKLLYRAHEALDVEEYTSDHRKWWKLPIAS